MFASPPRYDELVRTTAARSISLRVISRCAIRAALSAGLFAATATPFICFAKERPWKATSSGRPASAAIQIICSSHACGCGGGAGSDGIAGGKGSSGDTAASSRRVHRGIGGTEVAAVLAVAMVERAATVVAGQVVASTAAATVAATAAAATVAERAEAAAMAVAEMAVALVAATAADRVAATAKRRVASSRWLGWRRRRRWRRWWWQWWWRRRRWRNRRRWWRRWRR